MRLKLLAIFAGKGDINEVVVTPKSLKRVFDIFFKVIPFETKSFNHFASCPRWLVVVFVATVFTIFTSR